MRRKASRRTLISTCQTARSPAGAKQSDGTTYLIKTDTQGDVSPICQFPNSDLPLGSLVYASDGNFYGIAEAYPGDNYSYIYRITPAGAFSKFYNFPGYYGAGVVGLVQAPDGNLYGIMQYEGANGGGMFYKLTLSGQFTLLYSFPAAGAASHPQALVQASDGNFYGATLGSGGDTVIFRITASGQYTMIHKMASNDGQCQCELTQGSDGIVYGIANSLGVGGRGTFFAVDAQLPKPAPQAQQFSPQTGAPGANVRIWGYNLLDATVQFNGVGATTVRNSGPNYVWATVPAGASSGPITVSTPGGTSITQASFTVN